MGNRNTDSINSAGAIVRGSVRDGISFGCVLAMIISYVKWNSIIWAIVHGSLSWAYVIYYVIKYL